MPSWTHGLVWYGEGMLFASLSNYKNKTAPAFPTSQEIKNRNLSSAPALRPILIHQFKEINLKSLICWLLTICCASFSPDSSTAMETRRDRRLGSLIQDGNLMVNLISWQPRGPWEVTVKSRAVEFESNKWLSRTKNRGYLCHFSCDS